ncbi:MAG: SpoIIE family protein phosphatase [Lachnospiraceae bacterium]|nr:SpoIIE family protein phosphatase [Lachnospiraceae bacterium]
MKLFQTIKSRGTSLYTIVIGSIIIMLIIFAFTTVTIGSFAFTSSFSKEYKDSVYRVALTAAGWVDGDNIDKYLELGEDVLTEGYKEYNNRLINSDNAYYLTEDNERYVAEYGLTKSDIVDFCNDLNMSVIYVIVPSSDYKHYTSVFNCLNSNSTYDPWPVGYVSETSSEDYINAYRNIFEYGSTKEIVNRINVDEGSHPHLTALVPIKGSDGSVRAIMCAQRYVDELVDMKNTFFQGVGALTLIVIVIMFVIASKFLTKHVVSPVKTIAKETDRFSNENAKGDVSLTNDISVIKEIQTLASAVNKMEDNTLKNIENITKYTKQSERMGYELELASKIQAGMLPNKEQFGIERNGFDIHAIMKPAKEVGGDFYDFFMVDEDHIAILVADVSDKGVGAAFFMAISKTLLKSRACLGGSAKEIISYSEKLISEKNEAGMFVTIWLGIINLKTGHVNACNAGHDYPAIMLDNEEGFVIKKTPHGPPLGFLPGSEFVEYDFDLKPGNRIFLYTDGLNEAKNSSGERFGTGRIVDVLNDYKDESCENTLLRMRMAVDDFAKDEPQFDDMTMLGFTYLGK